MVKLMLVLIALFTSSLELSAGTYLKINKERVIEVKGSIYNLSTQSSKLLELADESKKPVYITIDSPGGSVLAGLELMNAIIRVKSRKIPVVCIVEGMAASMAMHIFGACSHRYSYPLSILMWHKASVNTQFVNEDDAKDIQEQLTLLVALLDRALFKALGVSKKIFDKFNEKEYIILANYFDKHLNRDFMTIIVDVRGK